MFLLVVCTDASSHRLVRRPSQPALALRRSLRRLVVSAGAYRPCRESHSVNRFPHSSRCGRVHLPAGRDKDRQLTLHTARARTALRSLRLWHANRASPRRGLSTVALGTLWVAPHFLAFGICSPILDRPLVSVFSSPSRAGGWRGSGAGEIAAS